MKRLFLDFFSKVAFVVRNQNGVIFPITVIVSFFFLLALAHVLELYQMEMGSIEYEQQSYEVDSIMQMAIVDVKKQIASFSNLQGNEGVFIYPIGKANYKWEKIDEMKVKAMVSAYSDGEIRYSATFVVLFPSLDIIQWTENNSS
jgi:competence protein ComGG